MNENLDILVFAAHPDDAELSCGGTLIKHAEMGYKTGIIDLTEGELSTRGTVETRRQEATNAAKILGVVVRENLGFKDGWFKNDDDNKIAIIQKVRQYRPRIILTNAIDDRHPDHGRAAKLVAEASWLAGLEKIQTDINSAPQLPYRTHKLFHFVQHLPLTPDFVVDISGYYEKKLQAILAYKTQFYNPENTESPTLISSEAYIDLLKAKSLLHGNYGMINHAEGFTYSFKIAVNDLLDLV